MLNLFIKYLDNQCSPEEVKTLLAHFHAPENEIQLRRLILESLEKGHFSEENIHHEWNEAAEKTYQQIKRQMSGDSDTELKAVPIPVHKRTRIGTPKLWIGVAASVIIISVAGFFLLQKKEQTEKPVVQNEKKFENDIAPGGDKAILTLADGRQIILDNTKNGTIAQEGSVQVMKTEEGELVYTNTNDQASEVFYNTVSTPRGGQYRLVLPDGSKVWLNANSSIRFPNVFNGTERKVEIGGEAYFEVTKNKTRPFKVTVVSSAGEVKSEIEVLGTYFNINSYDNEATIKTTLIEGAVKVKKGNNLLLLSPGQQAQLNSNGEMKLARDVDVEAIMAWKNGKFIFSYDDIQSVMRQLERWYDIVVEYKGNITKEEFIGVISRNVSISQILNMLEKSGYVKFEVRGRKVIVQ